MERKICITLDFTAFPQFLKTTLCNSSWHICNTSWHILRHFVAYPATVHGIINHPCSAPSLCAEIHTRSAKACCISELTLYPKGLVSQYLYRYLPDMSSCASVSMSFQKFWLKSAVCSVACSHVTFV